MPFYLLGLIVVLLLKTFVHDKGDQRLEWVKRVLEVPADACILSLMMIVAGGAAGKVKSEDPSFWTLAAVGIALLSIILYKHGSKNASDQGGQIQFSSFSLFITFFISNVCLAILSILLVSDLGIL